MGGVQYWFDEAKFTNSRKKIKIITYKVKDIDVL